MEILRVKLYKLQQIGHPQRTNEVFRVTIAQTLNGRIAFHASAPWTHICRISRNWSGHALPAAAKPPAMRYR
eukprot:94828-Hanusia_phi.AAC.1